MAQQTPTGPPTHRVREARTEDLSHLEGIEAAAGQTFVPLFGTLDWDEPTSGEHRARTPGFLLVVAEPGRAPVGFAHVLHLGGAAHLEQLDVHPDHHRMGLGTALVIAAIERAAAEGHARLTLSTYADVPWNAPFYRRLGFEVVDRLTPLERALQDKERAMGMMRHGRRVVMQVPLPREVTGR